MATITSDEVLANEPALTHHADLGEKDVADEKVVASSTEDEKGDGAHWAKTDVESAGSYASEVLENERDIATHVISTGDDPTLSPWTFRPLFIGIGLSAFGGVLGMNPCYMVLKAVYSSKIMLLAEIYYFKPVRDYLGCPRTSPC